MEQLDGLKALAERYLPNAAVNLIRAINAVEVTYKVQDASHFATWDDLGGSEAFKASRPRSERCEKC
jgi:hypothetical protein